MGVLDKFLDIMKLSDEDDDYDNVDFFDDEYDDDYDDRPRQGLVLPYIFLLIPLRHICI